MLASFLGITDPAWVAVIVAALTALATQLASAPLRLLVDTRLLRVKAKTEYEYEQRKELRRKIGEYHGRLVEAASSFNYRLTNLQANYAKGWLNVGGVYNVPSTEGYYFPTMVYRFMLLAGLANKFEREAIFIDSRIAERKDQLFLYYVKALRWCMTDVALFNGLEYDISTPTDHFFTDHLRHMCRTLVDDDTELDLARFDQILLGEHELDTVLRYFDGLAPGQLRWDRLFAYELLLLAFLNNFGYDLHRSADEWFERTAGQIKHRRVAKNLRAWLPKLGLGKDREARKIERALDARVRELTFQADEG
jgi:hypothetical protein